MKTFSRRRLYCNAAILMIVLASVSLFSTIAAITQSAARSLFCAHGSIGMRPNPLPRGFETQFAIAVVEIQSPTEVSNVAVTEFSLFNKDGQETKLKRVIEVEEFARTSVAGEGSFAYYLNPGGTRPWDGRLPARTVQLRVRAALLETPMQPVRFRLVIGTNVIEGKVDGRWQT
jgi:hypothetical protein